MAEKLFEDFPPISTEEWKARVLKDLKGKAPSVLEGQLEGGPEYRPFYRSEDLIGLEYLQSSRPTAGWSLHHDFRYASAEALQKLLAGETGEALQSAGIVLAWELRSHQSGLQVFGEDHLNSGLHAFFAQDIAVLPALVQGRDLWIQAGNAGIPVLTALLKTPDLHPQQIGGLDAGFNEIFLRSGRFPGGGEREWAQALQAMLLSCKQKLENFRPLCISASPFHNAGANPAQEIAAILSMLNWSFEHLSSDELSPKDILTGAWVEVSMGTDFYGEISKLRALRHLIYQLARAWKIEGDLEGMLHLSTRGSAYYHSGLDVHSNLLRSTTQGMAAIMGGCDRLALPEFDLLVHEVSESSTRIARNIQLILRDETFLGEVADPGGGAWYLENLTHQWVLKAWDQFLEIEKEGGILKVLANASLQDSVEANLKDRQEKTDMRKLTVLGANQYPNPQDSAAHLLESRVISFVELQARGGSLKGLAGMSSPETLRDIDNLVTGLPQDAFLASLAEQIAPVGPAAFKGLASHRASLPYEELRAQKLQYQEFMGTDLPLIWLMSWGHPASRTARKNFATNLLHISGFPIQANSDPDDREGSLGEMESAKPFMVVLCSSDSDYLEDGASWIEAITGKFPGVSLGLAGRPDKEGRLKEAGVHTFIYAGMNVRSFSEQLLAPFKVKN